ncbi:hypothetical protein ILUMI_07199, partial [Ignelater luminosus]
CDYLSSVGVENGTSLTNNILKRCLTNQLASSFSFRGKGVKKPFVDLSLKSVVVGTVKKQFSGLTETEIEDHIKVWLKHLPQRFKAKTSDPFVIAVFLTSYLSDFIQELKHLLRNSPLFPEKTYSISIHSFVCDAPARAFLKCIKTHSGYSCCERCLKPGEYFNSRVVVTGISAPKRNNRSFRMQLDEEHHIGISPLVDLPIDLVIKFPIEYMHNGTRLSSSKTKEVSRRLKSIKSCIPFEFNRKARLLLEMFDNVSSFPFQNYLGQLKKLVRCPNNPLQVCRRLSEINTLETRINLSDDIFTGQGLKLVHNLGPIPKVLRNIEFEQFKKIVSHNFVLTIHSYSNCDAYCFVKGSFVVQIHNILRNIQTDNIRIVGTRYTRHEPLFNYPFESTRYLPCL